MRLKEKVAIVTGGAHGMGEAEARLFAAEGAKVVVADILEHEAEMVAADIRASGEEAVAAKIDVTSESERVGLIAKAVATYGKLDILVNNAGISGSSVGDPDGLDGWHRIIASTRPAFSSAQSSPPSRWRKPVAARSSTSVPLWGLSAAPADIRLITHPKVRCGSTRKPQQCGTARLGSGSIPSIRAICHRC